MNKIFNIQNKFLLALAAGLSVFIMAILVLIFLPRNTTNVLVSSSPSSAVVTISGYNETFTTPFTLNDILIGTSLSLTVSKDEYRPQRREVPITEKPQQEIHFVLERSLPETTEDIDHASEGLRIEQDTEYIEKIEREPFWEQLPYYAENYKIEYKDSDDKIIITTFPPASNIQEYRQQALRWLQDNGAQVDTLTIEYRQGIKNYTL